MPCIEPYSFFCSEKRFRCVGLLEFPRVSEGLTAQRVFTKILLDYPPSNSSHRCRNSNSCPCEIWVISLQTRPTSVSYRTLLLIMALHSYFPWYDQGSREKYIKKLKETYKNFSNPSIIKIINIFKKNTGTTTWSTGSTRCVTTAYSSYSELSRKLVST